MSCINHKEAPGELPLKLNDTVNSNPSQWKAHKYKSMVSNLSDSYMQWALLLVNAAKSIEFYTK